jgi:hypothetical protein
MPKPYSFIYFLFLFLLIQTSAYSQTLLEAGDIAFTGYITADDNNATQDDQISFVLLKDIDVGTTIFFSDFGWTNAGKFQSVDPCGVNTGSYNDGLISWTASSVLTCGTRVTINCRRALMANTGTVSGLTATFNNGNVYLSLSPSDQVFAFQGTPSGVPAFVAALSINRDWDVLLDSCDFTSNRSMLPASLNSGVIALFPDANNAVYNCSVTSGDTLTLLTALTDVLNWNTDTTSGPPVPSGFTLPPNCVFSGCALTPPSITSQPVNVSDCEDDTVSFSITSQNATAWQWQRNISGVWNNVLDTVPFSGSTTETLTISGIPFSLNSTQFRCVAFGAAPPNAISTTATLTVVRKPTLISQTPDRAICEGNNATFNATVAGAGLSYQWQSNNGGGWTNLTNNPPYSAVTGPTLVITAAPASLNGIQYRCLINGTCPPAINSTPVTLFVNVLPNITSEPVNDTICAGDTARFSIAAVGSGPGYRWQVNTGSGFVNVTNGGGLYFGANTPNLTIVNPPALLNGARYRCYVTGFCTPTDTSAEAKLFIGQVPPAPVFSTGSNQQCQNDSGVVFGVTPVDSISTYTWTYSGSDATLNSGTSNTATIDFGVNAGNGTLSVAASNQCGTGTAGTFAITLNTSYTFRDTVRVCPGDSVLIYGFWQSLEGDYTDAFLSDAGCDSNYITTLQFYPSYLLNPQVFICPGDSFFVAGNWQTQAGIYTDSLETFEGCDSITNTELIIALVYSESVNTSICSGDSIFLEGAWQTQAGVYTDNLFSIYGCDSTVVTTLNILSTDLINTNVSICNGDSVFLQGAWQTQTGIYTDIFSNTNGCDSTIITSLSVSLPAVSLSLDTTVCINQSPITLFGATPAGGSWSGAGVTGNQFDPQAAGAGSFVITYSYTDSIGCINTASDTVVVDLCSGLSESNPLGIALFPNPAGETVNIRFGNAVVSNGVISLFSKNGQLVKTLRINKNISGGQIEIPLSDLPAGSYLLMLESKEGISRLPLIITR